MALPINEDTAALVAAQLTLAWATRAGPQKPDPALQFDAQVLSMYLRFRDHVREVSIKASL